MHHGAVPWTSNCSSSKIWEFDHTTCVRGSECGQLRSQPHAIAADRNQNWAVHLRATTTSIQDFPTQIWRKNSEDGKAQILNHYQTGRQIYSWEQYTNFPSNQAFRLRTSNCTKKGKSSYTGSHSKTETQTLQRGLVLEHMYWKASEKVSELFVTLRKLLNLWLVQTGRVTLTAKPQPPPHSSSLRKGTGVRKNDWVSFLKDSKEEEV